MKRTITLLLLFSIFLVNAQAISTEETNLEQYFKNINANNIEYLVPYKNSQAKFGWYDLRDLKIITPAVFDSADFEYNKILYFTYNSVDYEFSLPQKIKKVEYLRGFPTEPIADEGIAGFKIEDGSYRYSTKFKELQIINENANSKIAIATNLNSKKGLINQDGTVLAGLDFNFNQLDYFQNDKKEIYFLTKKPNDIDFYIYDRNGKEVKFMPFIEYNIVSADGKLYPNYITPYQDEKLCVIKLENHQQNVFDENTFKFILPQAYSNIEHVRVIKSKKKKKYLVRIKSGRDNFYVDQTGKNYDYVINSIKPN
ncbi:hypothetical protein [Flavobacterium anhuiense]|uniref:hypothetical protein n=1 Tax=Flavobacterium anhuiense TaxID=459526 RepID=UPI003D99F28E